MQSFTIDKKYIRCVLIDQVGVYVRDVTMSFVVYPYNDPDSFDDWGSASFSAARCTNRWVYIHID
jgi:hypothetical protein